MVELRTSRRTFLKSTAGVALGYALGAFAPANVFANNNDTLGTSTEGLSHFTYKSASLSNLPTAIEAAKQSAMVSAAFTSLLSIASTIENSDLRGQVLTMIKDPNPQVAHLYTSSATVQSLYNKLANAGYIKTDAVPLDKLVPPYTGKAPQDFYTAPGSGYHSHHAYPGGLATHVDSNMKITSAIVDTYRQVFGYDPGHDAAIAGQALHDIAKPWVFQWQKDGSSLKEYTIAGTGAHHIYSIAESMVRNLPAEEVVAQACAHENPGTDSTEASIVDWLKAAAIIADINPISYGVLTRDGKHLPTPHKQAGYIVHLGDHDWVLTVPASNKAEEALKQVAQTNYGIDANTDGVTFNNFRNFVTSQVSSMQIHDLLSRENGTQQLAKLVNTLIKK